MIKVCQMRGGESGIYRRNHKWDNQTVIRFTILQPSTPLHSFATAWDMDNLKTFGIHATVRVTPMLKVPEPFAGPQG